MVAWITNVQSVGNRLKVKLFYKMLLLALKCSFLGISLMDTFFSLCSHLHRVPRAWVKVKSVIETPRQTWKSVSWGERESEQMQSIKVESIESVESSALAHSTHFRTFSKLVINYTQNYIHFTMTRFFLSLHTEIIIASACNSDCIESATCELLDDDHHFIDRLENHLIKKWKRFNCVPCSLLISLQSAWLFHFLLGVVLYSTDLTCSTRLGVIDETARQMASWIEHI